MPTVSVLLPVYNAGRYLQESVESILCQTYASYELLILDDGSTDGCTDFLKGISDERIRLVKRKHNYIKTLNHGLSIARGKYIARMDADDKMFPTRLAEQVRILDENPEVTLCCSYMQQMAGSEIYNSGIQGTLHHFAHILLLGNFISHPTVMIRTDYLRNNHLEYRHRYIYAEDYRLWSEIACSGGKLHIIPKPLLEYRVSEKQVSRIYDKEQAETANKIRNQLLIYLIERQTGKIRLHLKKLYNAYALLNEDGLLDDTEIFYSFYLLFSNIIAEDED